MLEKEQRYVEALRSELARCTDPASEAKFVQELTGAERRVRTLQEKLFSQTTKAHSHNHGPNHDGEVSAYAIFTSYLRAGNNIRLILNSAVTCTAL